MPTETPTQRLASVLMGEPVMPWINQRRAAGKTWRAIRHDLIAMTKGEVNVPIQTLINWDRSAKEQAAAEQLAEQAS